MRPVVQAHPTRNCKVTNIYVWKKLLIYLTIQVVKILKKKNLSILLDSS